MIEDLVDVFPGLRLKQFWLTSPFDADYNCIAWAADDTDNYWWPVGESPRIYWPSGVPREETLDAFAAALATRGYVAQDDKDESLEPGLEKVALFANVFGVPTHAARQLASGLWASKLGKDVDIEHDLNALEGDAYGAVALILKRPTAAASA